VAISATIFLFIVIIMCIDVGKIKKYFSRTIDNRRRQDAHYIKI